MRGIDDINGMHNGEYLWHNDKQWRVENIFFNEPALQQAIDALPASKTYLKVIMKNEQGGLLGLSRYVLLSTTRS